MTSENVFILLPIHIYEKKYLSKDYKYIYGNIHNILQNINSIKEITSSQSIDEIPI